VQEINFTAFCQSVVDDYLIFILKANHMDNCKHSYGILVSFLAKTLDNM